MKVIIGLGNPGSRYADTRHNIGWMVLDAVALQLRTGFKAGRGEYYEAVGRWRGTEVHLVKPTTFMNLSGIAARQVLERHRLEPEELLAIVDEIQFPTGRVQLKPGGSDGGHNGLESLVEQIGTESFPRLRCGIGSNFERGAMAEYVLSPFPSEERETVEWMVKAGRDLALAWVALGTAKAMSEYNRSHREPVPPGHGDVGKDEANQ
jgi:PTH1 family peptidyl-tRNA hydrolase